MGPTEILEDLLKQRTTRPNFYLKNIKSKEQEVSTRFYLDDGTERVMKLNIASTVKMVIERLKRAFDIPKDDLRVWGVFQCYSNGAHVLQSPLSTPFTSDFKFMFRPLPTERNARDDDREGIPGQGKERGLNDEADERDTPKKRYIRIQYKNAHRSVQIRRETTCHDVIQTIFTESNSSEDVSLFSLYAVRSNRGKTRRR